jgi:hypothetical protein
MSVPRPDGRTFACSSSASSAPAQDNPANGRSETPQASCAGSAPAPPTHRGGPRSDRGHPFRKEGR